MLSDRAAFSAACSCDRHSGGCVFLDREDKVLRKSKVKLFLILMSAAMWSCTVSARGPLLATETAWQWGGPETRWRCIKMAKTNGFKCSGIKCRRTTWSTCSEGALDLKQHRIIARMYGPTNIRNPSQQ